MHHIFLTTCHQLYSVFFEFRTNSVQKTPTEELAPKQKITILRTEQKTHNCVSNYFLRVFGLKSNYQISENQIVILKETKSGQTDKHFNLSGLFFGSCLFVASEDHVPDHASKLIRKLELRDLSRRNLVRWTLDVFFQPASDLQRPFNLGPR